MGRARLYVLATVKGLVREAAEVRKAFEELAPDVVCLSVSPRELAEVRYTLYEEGFYSDQDYVPESLRDLPPVTSDRGAVPDDTGEGDSRDGRENEGEGADDGPAPIPDELEMPGGIVSREDVEEALDEPFHPDLMSLESGAKSDRIFISDTDMAYSQKLAAFGDVELPPPAFRQAVKMADGRGIPVVPVDLDDDMYTEIFCDHVPTMQLFKHSRKVRSMRRRLKARSPEELMLEWDRRIRSIRGFNVVERERERKMAAGLVGELERHQVVLAVVDLPRVDGTLKELARRVGDA